MSHMRFSHVVPSIGDIYEWVMSHVWMSHVTHMNESCHTCESCPTYERIMSHIWVIPHIWVMLHMWMTHVTDKTESRCVVCNGVATISRLLKIIGLFCRILSVLYGSFAKETYHFEESPNSSHPIATHTNNTHIESSPTYLHMSPRRVITESRWDSENTQTIPF